MENPELNHHFYLRTEIGTEEALQENDFNVLTIVVQ